MGSLIIHTSNPKDLSILKELVFKMGFESQILTDFDKEDIKLGKAIEENNPVNHLNLEDPKTYYQGLDKSN